MKIETDELVVVFFAAITIPLRFQIQNIKFCFSSFSFVSFNLNLNENSVWNQWLIIIVLKHVKCAYVREFSINSEKRYSPWRNEQKDKRKKKLWINHYFMWNEPFSVGIHFLSSIDFSYLSRSIAFHFAFFLNRFLCRPYTQCERFDSSPSFIHTCGIPIFIGYGTSMSTL